MNIGERMKMYEAMNDGIFMPHIPTCARIDGRAFHTFTRDLKRPYDENLSNLFVETLKFLVNETDAICGYTQSDEISLLWYNPVPNSQIFFSGRIFKMVSMLASLTTAYFNNKIPAFLPEKVNTLAFFEARVWNVPSLEEAVNYFIWREDDAVKNSVSMAAQSVYSHKELLKKDTSDKHEMLMAKGINWNGYPSFFKRGTYVQRKQKDVPFSVEEIEKLPLKHEARKNPNLIVSRKIIETLNLPPLRKIVNKVDVIFNGAEPVLKESVLNHLRNKENV